MSVSWFWKTALPAVVNTSPSSTKTTVKPATNMPVLTAMRLR